ncbi:unnamed protein product [Closterium sp. NIES-64]|nr:unnamed protein product [Closterium sp. NIES-64]
MDVVGRAVSGMLEGDVSDSKDTTAESSHDSNRTAERTSKARLRRQRYMLLGEDLAGMGDKEFRDLFRINRAILEYIVAGMTYYMLPYVERYFITHAIANLVAIKYLASGMAYVDLSHFFGLSKTLCHALVDVWLMHFPSVFNQQWVHYPTAEDLAEMAEEFREYLLCLSVASLPAMEPSVVAAIGGVRGRLGGSVRGHAVAGRRSGHRLMEAFARNSLNLLHPGANKPFELAHRVIVAALDHLTDELRGRHGGRLRYARALGGRGALRRRGCACKE